MGMDGNGQLFYTPMIRMKFTHNKPTKLTTGHSNKAQQLETNSTYTHGLKSPESSTGYIAVALSWGPGNIIIIF